ncbi:MAG: formate dehydrogenase accessory sulfurtransferase FdhD [Euryarchaeota archaeon]|nr:formate dehydrogenase accessory sulfurtransferase FdhD [Euryarchaeota archaeon]
MMQKVKILKNGEEVEEYVAVERELKLIVNDKTIASVKLSPGYEEEFAIGYCFGEGLVKSLDSIVEVKIAGNVANVKADANFEASYERYILSDCISGWRARIETEDVQVASDFKVSAGEILEKMRELKEKSEIWKKTGGVHSVALVNGDKLLLVEDISRHIALDKIIGLGIREGVDLSSSYILTSGRLPGDMVIKAARVNVPIVVSRTAALSSGIECAEKCNLTLVGFVRGNRMNIYTHSERIKQG